MGGLPQDCAGCREMLLNNTAGHINWVLIHGYDTKPKTGEK